MLTGQGAEIMGDAPTPEMMALVALIHRHVDAVKGLHGAELELALAMIRSDHAASSRKIGMGEDAAAEMADNVEAWIRLALKSRPWTGARSGTVQ